MVLAIPNTTDTDEITDVLNANAHEYDEFGGQELTFYPGDVAAGWDASLTDAEGNVYTLELMGGPFDGLPLANLYENGADISNGEGFFASMRLVNGEVVAQNAKGFGWFGEHIAGATDPGPGDNASETPVVIPSDTPTAENPPTSASDDTVDDDTVDDTVINLAHTHHHHEHRMNFVKETASEDISTQSAAGGGIDLSTANLTNLATEVVADLTAIAKVDKVAVVSASLGCDYDQPHHGIAVTVDPSTTSPRTLLDFDTRARVTT